MLNNFKLITEINTQKITPLTGGMTSHVPDEAINCARTYRDTQTQFSPLFTIINKNAEGASRVSYA